MRIFWRTKIEMKQKKRWGWRKKMMKKPDEKNRTWVVWTWTHIWNHETLPSLFSGNFSPALERNPFCEPFFLFLLQTRRERIVTQWVNLTRCFFFKWDKNVNLQEMKSYVVYKIVEGKEKRVPLAQRTMSHVWRTWFKVPARYFLN